MGGMRVFILAALIAAVVADFQQLQAEYNKHMRAKQDAAHHQMNMLQQEIWGGDYIQFLEEEQQAAPFEHPAPSTASAPAAYAKRRPPAPAHDGSADDLNANAYDWMA